MVNTALVVLSAMASEEAEGTAHSVTPAYVYGLVAFGALMLLLFLTTRINIDR